MNQPSAKPTLNHEQIYNLLMTTGQDVTYVVEGEIGSGKSSLLDLFKERNADNFEAFIYFDCNTKDVGDITVPMVLQTVQTDSGVNIVSSAINDELGFQFTGPVVIMIDEIGKAQPGVKNALTRVCNERKLAGQELHPDSIVFATTNLGEENVGDSFLAHQLDRVSFIELRKATSEEWLKWGFSKDLDETVLAFAHDTPEIFHSFTEYADPDDNTYIHHPKAVGRNAFITLRSLTKGAAVVAKRNMLDQDQLFASLCGLWGYTAASEFISSLYLFDKLPTIDEIEADPEGLALPKKDAAMCALIFRAIRNLSSKFIVPWMTYIQRADHGMQTLFCTMMLAQDSPKRAIAFNNQEFKTWVMKNKHMFAADVMDVVNQEVS